MPDNHLCLHESIHKIGICCDAHNQIYSPASSPLYGQGLLYSGVGQLEKCTIT